MTESKQKVKVRKITISHVSAVVKNLDILRTVVLLTCKNIHFRRRYDTYNTIQIGIPV